MGRPAPRALRAALACAAAAVVCVSVLVWASLSSADNLPGRRLLSAAQAAPEPRLDVKNWKWDVRNVAGIVLSVLVSLTSTIDRESGVSLYMVLFAVLVGLPFRNAIAMTAFTVACGSFGPAIAAMSEPHVTERGVLALVDYPGALVVLPTMFWGLSMGVIVNMWFPSWLLALMWVVVLALSNAELLISYVRIRRCRAEALELSRELGEQQAAAAAAAADDTKLPAPAGGAAAGAPPALGAASLDRIKSVSRRAQQIEALALLYPAFYTPTIQELLERNNVDLDADDVLGRATHSEVDVLASVREEMGAALRASRWRRTRFTWRWKPWWALQNHFELSLVLKVVVLHLVTEAVRHHTTKPCTKRFWFMLFVMTGLVTAFLIFVVTSYSRKRTWRGPHWVDALAQATEAKKQQLREPSAAAGAGAGDAATAPAAAAAAAAGGGDAVAVAVDLSGDPAAADAAQKPGCCARLRRRLPWRWGPAADAVSNISSCNSVDQYRSWTLPRMLGAAAASQLIGIFGAALGLPSGPTLAWLLLALGLKPHVVAGTSRFLVLCFCFGMWVAYIISGNIRMRTQLAAAYGLINLALAPLGMALFRRLQLRAPTVLLISLLMGAVGMACVIVWEVVPLLMLLRGHEMQALRPGAQWSTARSVLDRGNHFDLSRFCRGVAV